MEDVVTLMQEAEKKLTEYDPIFVHKTEKVLGILRSKGVVSYRRLSENGRWHNLLAATLVLAHDKDTDFALPTRKQQTLYNRGVSTRIVSFLDNAVREGLIISQASDYTARGRLSLGDIIKAYLEHEQEAA